MGRACCRIATSGKHRPLASSSRSEGGGGLAGLYVICFNFGAMKKSQLHSQFHTAYRWSQTRVVWYGVRIAMLVALALCAVFLQQIDVWDFVAIASLVSFFSFLRPRNTSFDE